MRRRDREVTDINKIYDIINSCDCCRLGFKDIEGVYILPLNFGFIEEDNKKVLYFHGANEGKKIELIREQNYIGFEMDTKHKLIESDVACNYSFAYQSVIGKGYISLVENVEEKIRGLNCIMSHYSDKGNWHFTEDMLKTVTVMKLVVKELSCKERSM